MDRVQPSSGALSDLGDFTWSRVIRRSWSGGSVAAGPETQG